MEMTRENQIAAIDAGIKRLGINQHRLEVLAGLKVGTIKDLRRGKTTILRADKWQKITNVISEDVSRLVPVLGYVGAGAVVFPIDDHALGGAMEEVECPNGFDPSKYVALRIKGDSMLPMLRAGWLIFYTRDNEGVPHDCVNQICVVKLDDDRMMVKELRQGSAPGAYHLISHNAEPLFDQPLQWAAKVVDIRPL